MSFPSAELLDITSALESALGASAGFDRLAGELGAVAVAMLLLDGPRTEVKYFQGHAGQTDDLRIPDGQSDLKRVIEGSPGPVDAGNPQARALRDWFSLDANSFLLFHWRMRRCFVVTVFGFSEPVAPHRRVPDAMAERLNLVGLASYSIQEISRLRADLQAVSNRLARRKVVERAKGVLQTHQGLSEEQAYAYLRGSSRRRRIPLTELAEEVLRARARGSLALYLGQR